MSLEINGTLVGNQCYPNNERIFYEYNELKKANCIYFYLRYETDIDLINLMIYKKALDDISYKGKIKLFMPYIPYSRMDRKIDGFIFSFKYFCNFINWLNFDEVIVLDPHSNVSTALLNKVSELNFDYLITEVLKEEKVDYIFYPDAGAQKRYSEKMTTFKPVFYGNKSRDLSTGKINKLELVNPPDLVDGTILIIDDLCAKGGTFVGMAKLLKEAGAKRVILYVNHCEQSIYKGELLPTNWVDKVYSTNSILRYSNDKKIQLFDLLTLRKI